MQWSIAKGDIYWDFQVAFNKFPHKEGKENRVITGEDARILLACFIPFPAQNSLSATPSPALETAAVGDSLVRTRMQHLVIFLPQLHFSLL